ncbi:MAG TPA: DUF3891 family protein [Acidobacteriaceae bacterium]|nr:DUF3891 family protein [Acidobacteriaceae bacterium]
MLRMETETGWWLITHPDHARLAESFAEAWGNAQFASPEPRTHVLRGIRCHDDGWALRDANPQITRQGKPSAFSTELVGKYSAFEEIDLADYLAVRDRALRLTADKDAYAGLLISMHTCNLLTERADRATINPAQLPLLDDFLAAQTGYQNELKATIQQNADLSGEEKSETRIRDHFRLLQATDNLSLLSCVAYSEPATLLHPLPLRNREYSRIAVEPLEDRHFCLTPYPFAEPQLVFQFPARHVKGHTFATAAELQSKFAEAPVEMLAVTLSA